VVFAQFAWVKHTIEGDYNGARFVHAIDLDGDGDIDVLGAAGIAADITWFENDGDENFTEHTIDGNYVGAIIVHAIDLDSDGDIDVLGAASMDDIAWYENDGDENFTKHVIDAFDGARSIYAIDLDDDGDVDFLGAAFAADEIAWWENDGDENFTKHNIEVSFNGAYSVYAIDLDDDNDIDVLGTAYIAGDIVWFENDGDENFTKHNIDVSFAGAQSVYAIDVDDDNDIDVLGAAVLDNDITWWENDGDENFTEHTIAGSYYSASIICGRDLDGDDDIDVYGAGYNAAATAADLSWWENDGDENFTEHTIDTLFDGARCIYAIDLDDDNDIDILGAAYVADDICWWENVMHNVGPTSIEIPDAVPYDTTLHPQAIVKNFGTATETFNMTCMIEPGAYTSSYTVTSLASTNSIQITFPDEFTFESGTYTVTVYTQLAGDENPANDTLEKVIEAIAYYDVGVISINILDTVSVGTTLNPHATVSNFSINSETFSVTCTIDPGAYTSTTVSYLAPGDSTQVTFPDEFQFTEIGMYTVTVYTYLVGDQNPINDTLEKVIATDPGVAHDVGTVAIDIPDTISVGTTLNPHATVSNFSINPETFSVTCTIDPGAYTSTTVSYLAPGDSTQVTFPDEFTFESGIYTVTVYTQLVGDENPVNDTLEKVIVTYDPGIAEGNSVIPTSFSFGLKNNPVKGKAMFNLALPEAVIVMLRIYDVSGRLIDTPITGRKSAGHYEIPWDCGINAGVYFYSFESPYHSEVGKLVIVQ
jgi:hypothetical protein